MALILAVLRWLYIALHYSITFIVYISIMCENAMEECGTGHQDYAGCTIKQTDVHCILPFVAISQRQC